MTRGRPRTRLVLVTRPQPDAAATVAALAARGLSGLAAPLQVAVPVGPGRLPDAAALLLTSRNALRAIAGRQQLLALPVFCVGDSTASLARAVGFSSVHSAGGDAAALAALVARHRDPQDGPLLLPSAAGAGGGLAAMLRRAGFRVHRRTVYRMQAVGHLPPAAAEALAERRVGWVLFHAAGAASVFVRMVLNAGLAETLSDVAAVAISAAAAQPLGTLRWRRTRWPAQPTEAAMLALLPSPMKSRPQPA